MSNCRHILAVFFVISALNIFGENLKSEDPSSWTTRQVMERYISLKRITEKDIELDMQLKRLLLDQQEEAIKIAHEIALTVRDPRKVAGAIGFLDYDENKDAVRKTIFHVWDDLESYEDGGNGILKHLAWSLARNGKPEDVDYFIPLVRSKNKSIKYIAFDCIKRLGGEKSLQILRSERSRLEAQKNHSEIGVRGPIESLIQQTLHAEKEVLKKMNFQKIADEKEKLNKERQRATSEEAFKPLNNGKGKKSIKFWIILLVLLLTLIGLALRFSKKDK